MERKIGEIFEHNGEWYQCIIGHCNQCCFDEAGTCKFIGDPYCAYRNDKKLACFKKLEKVGEPYMNDEKIVQKYKIYHDPLIAKNGVVERYVPGFVDIEIKQNKEDMEEKKQKLDDLVGLYSSAQITYKEFDKELKALYIKQWEEDKPALKPFDLEAAKAGKPVCTRDGRKARIICFDLSEEYPIAARVYDNVGNKILLFSYKEDGRINNYDYKSDLMMLPEKKEGWVNVYKGSVCISVYPRIYKSRDEAVSDNTAANRIDTVKISWEE